MAYSDPYGSGAPNASDGGTPAASGGGKYWGMDENQFLDYLGSNIDSTISRDQWKAWLDENGGANVDSRCPPDKPFQTNGYDASGKKLVHCMDKPDDCPPGMGMSHTDSAGRRICKPNGEGGSGGGGGGTGGTGGGGAGAAAGDAWENAYLNKLMGEWDKRRTASAEDLFSESGLAGDMGATADAFTASLDADPVFANNPQLKATMIAKMKGDALTSANQGIQGLRQGYTDRLANAATGREGNSLNWATSKMTDATQNRGLTLNDRLGWANLNQAGSQFDKNYAAQNEQWNKTFDWNKKTYDTDWQRRQQEIANERKANKKNIWGQVLGGALSMISDEKTKEEIKPSPAGLDEVKQLKPIDYKYKNDVPGVGGEKATSYSAQEVEKVIPKAVKKGKAGNYAKVKMLDMTKMMAAHTNAIKELDAKISRLYKEDE